MNIMLGNLELSSIVKEEYIEMTKRFFEENGYKKVNKCDDVEGEIGNYHIYDIPRTLVICGEDKMKEFYNFLEKNDLIGKGFIGTVGLSFI